MKITINGPGGKRTFEATYLNVIKDQHKALCRYRDDGRKPTQDLLDDIAVYEFILKSDNPEKFAESYMIAAETERQRKKTLSIRKLDIAKKLGWEIECTRS